MDAIQGVVKSIAQWHALLDNLNSKISQRQIELAQVGEYRPPTRSLKRSGSTESLRPKDGDDSFPCFPNPESETPELSRTTIYPPTPPTSKDHGPDHPRPSPLPAPLLHASTSPVMLKRQSSTQKDLPATVTSSLPIKSSPIAAQTLQKPGVLRKRKPASMLSAESQVPKYRTRSMIIVYYDSAVQDAFEELVKYISSSRNNMRKGKMAARMAEMRRLAEVEVDGEEQEETYSLASVYRSSRQPAPMPRSYTPSKVAATSARDTGSKPVITSNEPPLMQADDDESDGEHEMPQLNFVSTRRMGPSRDGSSNAIASAPKASSPRAQNYSPMRSMIGARNLSLPTSAGGCASNPSQSSIYSELDCGLEWCQSMCEHAAHQFLRDGECSIEIQSIKRRLDDVKETAEKEIAAAAAASEGHEAKMAEATIEKEIQNFTTPSSFNRGQSRAFREICMRKPTETALKDQILEVDDRMEVDEGIEDMDVKLNWISPRHQVR